VGRKRGWWGGGLVVLLLSILLNGCTPESRVTFLTNEAYFDTLIAHLAGGKREIVISMFLFATGDHEGNRANQVREALIRAAKRGVRVRAFLDISEEDDFSTEANRTVAADLRRHGISVQFDSPGRTTHTKLVIIDQRYVFVGSHNFTHSALRHNNEASVLIESPQLAQEALAYLKGIEEHRAQGREAAEDRRRRSTRQNR
jgi:phosphatidylserine/phosphatidylglycerophosphate/cardiolipin synthase-like enzyme